MTNYNDIIKNVSLETGRDANDIISTLIDLEVVLRQSNNHIIITLPNDGDGAVSYVARPAYGPFWMVEDIRNPYEMVLGKRPYGTNRFYEFALETMIEGGFITTATEDDVKWHQMKHQAYWLSYEYDVIVLSDGDETITYYDPDDDYGFIMDGRHMSYEEAEESLFIEMYCDAFKVVFKGYREEVK